MRGAAHPKELPFEALIGLLEEREKDSPCHVEGRRVPKVVAQYGERPHEGPAVGMQLGGSHVDFYQQRPLEAGEGETQLNPLKDSLVEEEEGFSLVNPIIGTHGFALSIGRTNT